MLALEEVKNAMRALEDLFEKSFYTNEPSAEASAACALVFALYAFEEQVDKTSLQIFTFMKSSLQRYLST